MAQVVIRPQDGGQLITRTAASEPGVANYRVKRNWRRDLDGEVWREGFVPFVPDPAATDVEAQARPTTSAITLVRRVLWPNGSSSMVVGSATELFLLQPLTSYAVSGYWDSGYTGDNVRWLLIGSGFSPSGRRWQAEMVNGRLVLNNGVDLPVALEYGASSVKHLHELRDQGIARVSVIASLGDVLMCLGVDEFSSLTTGHLTSATVTVSQTGFVSSGSITATMTGGGSVTSSGAFFSAGDVGKHLIFSGEYRVRITGYTSPTSVTAVAVGSTPLTAVSSPTPFRTTAQFNPASAAVDSWSVVASAPWFTAAMVGRKISFSGAIRTVVAYHSPTHLKVDCDTPVGSGTPFVENPEAYLRPDQMANPPPIDSRNDRALWGGVGNPFDWAIGLTVNAIAGSFTITPTQSTAAFTAGDEVVVVGAGLDGGSLTRDAAGNPLTIIEVGPGMVRLSAPCQTTSTAATLFHARGIGSIAGYEDLEDDGGAILQAAKSGDLMTIFKDKSAFVATYTGNAERPFVFQPVSIGHDRSVHFRNCLATINGEVHTYPGRTAFWQFDPASRRVRSMPNSDLIENLFFDFASVDSTDAIFMADNTVTQELWLFVPGSPTDPVICFDYRWGTVSTADFGGFLHTGGAPAPTPVVTAAASVQGPGYAVGGESETWFVMGTSDGRLLTYAGVSGFQGGKPGWLAKQLYYRQISPSAVRATYECRVASGLSNFGDEVNQKQFTQYLVQFGAPADLVPYVRVEFWGSNSQAAGATKLGERDITGITGRMVPVHFLTHNLQDVLVTRPPVGTPSRPLRLLYRAWEIIKSGSRSHARR